MTEGFRRAAVSIFIGIFGVLGQPSQARAADQPDSMPRAATAQDSNAAPTQAAEEECPCHEHDTAQQGSTSAGSLEAASPQGPDEQQHGAGGSSRPDAQQHGDGTSGTAGGECACHGADGACPYHAGAAPTGEPHNGPPQILVLTLAPAALGTFQASNTWRAGGMLMIATPIAWHELELQVDLAFFGGPAGLASSLDFLLKRPFRIGDAWRPYIGIGPVGEPGALEHRAQRLLHLQLWSHGHGRRVLLVHERMRGHGLRRVHRGLRQAIP